MFGSVILATVTQRELLTLPAVEADIGTRVVNLTAIPRGVKLPAIAHYCEVADFPGGPIGPDEEVNHWVGRMTIRVMCEGTSLDDILDAAQAQYEHFKGMELNEEIAGVWHQITFDPVGEVPITMLMDQQAQQFYRQLGTVYRVEITK